MRAEIVLTNVIMLFEFFSFFYVVFRREFRDFSHKIIMGLALWGVTWSIALLVGYDWQKRILGPFSAFYIAYVLLIWLMFEIPFFEMMLMVMAVSLLELPLIPELVVMILVGVATYVILSVIFKVESFVYILNTAKPLLAKLRKK